jgi:hypothetical protein
MLAMRWINGRLYLKRVRSCRRRLVTGWVEA